MTLLIRAHTPMIRKWIQTISWVLLFFTLFMACEELPCDDTNGVQLNLGFYKINKALLADTTIDTITVQLYNVIDTPYTETFYAKQSLNLPLSQLADSSTIIFVYKDSIFDTLIFRYNQSLILENHKCGFATFFELNNITCTSNRLDSVWIRKNLVEYGDEENVKIYF